MNKIKAIPVPPPVEDTVEMDSSPVLRKQKTFPVPGVSARQLIEKVPKQNHSESSLFSKSGS